MGTNAFQVRTVLAGGIALLFVALLSGCWLSPAIPPDPSAGQGVNPVELSAPDSTLANIREAFRAANAGAYMRSFADSLDPSNPERFTALFDFNDRTALPPNPGNPSDPLTKLVNGDWHTEQERGAMTSVMNGYPLVPDTTRCQFSNIIRTQDSPTQFTFSVNYTLKVNQGNIVTYQGTALLVFRLNSAGNWVILRWDDQRLNTANPPPTWGKLRYSNFRS